MTMRVGVLKLLWARGGNQCSMPGCGRSLASENGVFGEVAHICARSAGGPRGRTGRGSDEYENLILLCPEHHKVIDLAPEEWPAERLKQIKRAHEDSVQKVMSEEWAKRSSNCTLIVFCGASSVGKDVVASRVRRKLLEKFGFDLEFLDKYTTRLRRGDRESIGREDRIPGSLYEPSSTYQFLTEGRFGADDDCFFRYRKYGKSRYAFSRRHLLSRDPEDRNLACILGALHRVGEFRREVEEVCQRAVFSVLLEAPSDELHDRLQLRSTLSAEERDRRRRELDKDLTRIEALKKASSSVTGPFDLAVDNGTTSLREVVKWVTERIGQWLLWREWIRGERTLESWAE